MSTSFLAPHDPHYPQWSAIIQYEPDPRVQQMSGGLVASVPLEIRNDPAKVAEYLSGPTSAALVGSVVASAEREAQPYIQRMEADKDELFKVNQRLTQVNEERRLLPDVPIDGPHGRRVTPRENRIQLADAQRVVSQRTLVNDTEHQHDGRAGWLAHLVALVIAGFELLVSVRMFNVSFTHLVLLTFIPWVAVTAGLALFNDRVSAWLGHRIRDARETQRSARELNNRGMSNAHNRSFGGTS